MTTEPEPDLAEYRHKPGDKVASYVLEAPLGRGGFSEVWRAKPFLRTESWGEYEQDGSGLARTVSRDVYGPPVALKLLVRDEHVRELRQEAKALGVVRGEGIVRTLGANLEHEPPYLALEYLRGGDLRKQLHAGGGRFAPARALWLVERLLETLTRVHREGIVHGDLKPENVLFDEHGAPLLADFGLSRRILQRTGTLSVSLSAADARLAGTIDYMAPEQRAGEKPTLRSDVYAIGVIFHELVFGERPQGFTRKATERDPRLPPLADRLLEHALAPDPRDRYESAGALLKALRVELWNDARALEAVSKGLRERIVLGHAWTLVWGAVAAFAWLIALLGESNGRTRLWDLFDLDLLTGALAASLPLALVRPLARRWRERNAGAHAKLAQQLETLEAWRKIEPEAPAADETAGEGAAGEAKRATALGCLGSLGRGCAIVAAAAIVLTFAIGFGDVWLRRAFIGSAFAPRRDPPPPAPSPEPVSPLPPRSASSPVAAQVPEADPELGTALVLVEGYGGPPSAANLARASDLLELAAAGPRPGDPVLAPRLEKIVGSCKTTKGAWFVAAYGLEELAAPAFPEPRVFSWSRTLERSWSSAPFDVAVHDVAQAAGVSVRFDPLAAPAYVQGTFSGRPWRILVQLSQLPPRQALVVSPEGIALVPRTGWTGSGSEGEALAGELGPLLGRRVTLAEGAALGPGPADARLYDPWKALRAAAAMNGCEVRGREPEGPLEVAPRAR